MTTLTVRGLDPEVKQRLRERAARHGHSMESEVRQVLAESVASDEQPERTLLEAMRAVPGVGLTEKDVELIASMRSGDVSSAAIRPGQLWWLEDES